MRISLILLVPFLIVQCGSEVPTIPQPVSFAGPQKDFSPRTVEKFLSKNDFSMLMDYQIPWIHYIPPTNYDSLRLNLDTVSHLFKYTNYTGTFKLDDFRDLHKYQPASPWLNDHIFQHEDQDVKIHRSEVERDTFTEIQWLMWDQSFLFSIERAPHFKNGVFAITVFKDVSNYMTTLHYLTYTPEGKLIGQFTAAELHAEGGYWHQTEGYFENDSTYVTYGEWGEACEKGDCYYKIDTSRIRVCSNGEIIDL